MRPLKIMLADLMYFNKHRGWMQVVPINIGFIGQYLNQEFGKEVDVSLYKNPLDFMEALKETKPDIVGLAEFYKISASGNTVIGLEGARFVVDSGVYNSTIATSLVISQTILFF